MSNLKKDEKVENEVVTEKNEITSENKEQRDNTEDVKTEKTEKVKENKEQEVTKTEAKKSLIANTSFVDKYTRTVYEKGTEFIIDNVEETEKIGDKKYKISKARAEQIKSKGYIE